MFGTHRNGNTCGIHCHQRFGYFVGDQKSIYINQSHGVRQFNNTNEEGDSRIPDGLFLTNHNVILWNKRHIWKLCLGGVFKEKKDRHWYTKKEPEIVQEPFREEQIGFCIAK